MILFLWILAVAQVFLLAIYAIGAIYMLRFFDKLGAIEDYMMQLPDRLPEGRCNFPADDKPFVQTAPPMGRCFSSR